MLKDRVQKLFEAYDETSWTIRRSIQQLIKQDPEKLKHVIAAAESIFNDPIARIPNKVNYDFLRTTLRLDPKIKMDSDAIIAILSTISEYERSGDL